MRIVKAVLMLIIGAWSLGSGILSLSVIPMGAEAYDASDEALQLSNELIREAAPDMPPLGDETSSETMSADRSVDVSNAHRTTGVLLVLAGLLSLVAGVSLLSRCMPALLWIAIGAGLIVEAISYAWLREGLIWTSIKAAVLVTVGLTACRRRTPTKKTEPTNT